MNSQKRKPGNFDLYEKHGDQWRCKTCSGTIMAVTVLHPIWDGPFPCSGSGRVQRGEDSQTKPNSGGVFSILPYCPLCEEKPSSQGAPIRT